MSEDSAGLREYLVGIGAICCETCAGKLSDEQIDELTGLQMELEEFLARALYANERAVNLRGEIAEAIEGWLPTTAKAWRDN